jgi:hypothetical protein
MVKKNHKGYKEGAKKTMEEETLRSCFPPFSLFSSLCPLWLNREFLIRPVPVYSFSTKGGIIIDTNGI